MKKLTRVWLLGGALIVFGAGRGWWGEAAPQQPLMTLPQAGKRVPADARYAGPQACAACHAPLVAGQQKTAMARALEPAASCEILRAHPRLEFRLGPYTYLVTREGDRSLYTVSDGALTISAPIRYCFGQGKAGQTYVVEHQGVFYESRLSFYNDTRGLDITLGYPREVPGSLVEALGRAMSADETRSCFGCHSTGAVRGQRLELQHLMPGVSCEACHGPGENHIVAVKAGQPGEARPASLRGVDGDELTQVVCGTCHRSAEDVLSLPRLGGINNVRFQPYRIFNSRCYSDDRRIGCTACHNPHEDLRHDAAFYDAKCLACHLPDRQTPPTAQRAAPPCPTGKRDCASCHMPKVELPGAHFKFTDHRIRIARPGAPFPP
ncbi:MAG TPA: multiheme c-type cytochrome [Blastocatellia bacterium]|nr:multiheme c-type cytochrome [Blastocatellia bacterium]